MFRKKIFYFIILIALVGAAFGVGFSVGKNQVVCKVCKPETLEFSLFWDAYNKLRDNFIDPGKIDEQKIIYGAISGMTKSLEDPYTDFFSPEQAKIFQQDLTGSFGGVGIEIGIKKDQLTVIAPLKGTPAEKAGLGAGDIIVQVNGQSAADMTIDQAVSIIRGKKGTAVTLTIWREGWNQPKDFEIIRDTITIIPVEWELKEGDIAHIKIHQFGQSLPSDFTKIAREILSSPAKKIILDLRNNAGGYLEVCQENAGWFLKPGEIVAIEDFGGKKEQKVYKAQGNGMFSDYPTVVLMNKGSASAAEILAGALRDNKNIKLIGEKSFGKGSVQEVIGLHDKLSFLKITVAKWLTPKGNSIAEIGLTPDIKVEVSQDDVEANKDTQLQKAIEIIKAMN